MFSFNKIILFFFFISPAFAVTDDVGATIHLKKPAARIISLAPDITEILFAIGAGEKIVGVIDSCDYPRQAKKITSVGSYTGIDLERVIALHPDLIVTWDKTFSRQLNVLKTLGIPIYTTKPKHLEDVSHTLLHLGELTGNLPMARLASVNYQKKLDALRTTFQQQEPIRVFYQIGSYALITINKNSWINEAIKLCGGQNVFADAKFTAPEVTWEAVIAANPQVIISDATIQDWQKRWQHWPEIYAVKTKLLFSVSPDLISRAGPRLTEGIEILCQHLALARHVTLKK